MIKPSIPENSSESVDQKFERYVREGFVFHGSQDYDLGALEPRPATDTDKENSFNNDTAVFATPIPAAAVAFATVNKANVPE